MMKTEIHIDEKTGNLIFSEKNGYKRTHLNINNTLVEDFKLKIAVNDFQINRTRSLKDKSWENLELKINKFKLVKLVSRVRDLGTNKNIPCIDLQIQVDNKYDETVFHIDFERNINIENQGRIKLNIILKDNILIKELLEMLEGSNRSSVLNIEVNLQGIEGLYPVIASYDDCEKAPEIEPEFDIGVLHEGSIVNLDLEFKESLTTYRNDHLSIHSGELISFFITDEINNKS